MTNQAQARAPVPELLLTILTGPEAGVAYKLVGQSVTLGRSPENDVVLQDHKSSRSHARIERRGGDYWIKDLDSTAGVIVNGKPVKEGVLKAGDEIVVGATAMRFGSPQPPTLLQTAPPVPSSMPQLPLTKNANLGSPDPAAAGWMPPPSKTPSFSAPEEKKTTGALAIAAVVIIGIFVMRSHSSKRHDITVKDDTALEQEIEDTVETNEKRQQEIMAKGKDTQQYSEAQAFYLRGFREFRDENYGRAISDFEAALALYPDHPLAKRYLERSRLKNNELITEALERGERDFQLERYSAAFNEYRTVLLLTADPNNKNYQLAQKRIDAINLILMNNR